MDEIMLEKTSSWKDKIVSNDGVALVVPITKPYTAIKVVWGNRPPPPILVARFYQPDANGHWGWEIRYSDRQASPLHEGSHIELVFVNRLSPTGISKLIVQGRNFDKPRIRVDGNASISFNDALQMDKVTAMIEWGKSLGEVPEEDLCITKMWVADI